MAHWIYTTAIRTSILYGNLVWWPKVIQKSTKIQLGRIQKLACLPVTGAMKTTPTVAMELLLHLTALDLLIMAEARIAFYRLHIIKQPDVPDTSAGLLSIWKNVRERILDMRSDRTIPIFNFSKCIDVVIDAEYWRNKDPSYPEEVLVWYTDGSRTDSGTGSGIQGISKIEATAFIRENMPQISILKFMPFCNVHMKT
jgi:hypothetical protein